MDRLCSQHAKGEWAQLAQASAGVQAPLDHASIGGRALLGASHPPAQVSLFWQLMLSAQPPYIRVHAPKPALVAGCSLFLNSAYPPSCYPPIHHASSPSLATHSPREDGARVTLRFMVQTERARFGLGYVPRTCTACIAHTLIAQSMRHAGWGLAHL